MISQRESSSLHRVGSQSFINVEIVQKKVFLFYVSRGHVTGISLATIKVPLRSNS